MMMLFRMQCTDCEDFDSLQPHPFDSEFLSPMSPVGRIARGNCWVIKKGLFKYKIVESYVQYIYYSNTWGWKVAGIGYVYQNELRRRIFPYAEKDDAIKICLAMNGGGKVKIKYMR